ncbi:hypothetical protein [Ferrimonas balearica]|uniref:hypothetical protein n=1 Tax=Ferrimonas balearica TaxID=44012 RepID=UPI001C99A2C2|nr:hypothetical protein [Ferrimonas balearica]MBY5992340.1 hypothetical protein [Ferrimonas balearica]
MITTLLLLGSLGLSDAPAPDLAAVEWRCQRMARRAWSQCVKLGEESDPQCRQRAQIAYDYCLKKLTAKVPHPPLQAHRD